MKTTVEISDELMRELKLLSVRENRTLRSVLEEAVRKLLEDHRRQPGGGIRDASVDGGWMTPEFAEGGWEALRDEIYSIKEGLYRGDGA